MVPSFVVLVTTINLYHIVDIEMSCLLDMDGTTFPLNAVESIVALAVYGSYSV